MRVLVVTEIRLYRDGVADLLRALPDVACAATAATPAAAVTAARRHECDVALLDMTMGGTTGTVAALLAARPGIHVVALGLREDSPDVVACAEAGVSGYVSRDAAFEDLATALRSVVRGEVSCSGKVAAELIGYISRQARSRPGVAAAVPFTQREREVLRMLQTEMSNKEIARALDLQLSTVKNHVHNVLAKLGASGRSEIPGALARAETRYLQISGTPSS